MNYLHIDYEGVHTYLVYSMSQEDQIDLGLYNKMSTNLPDGIMPVKVLDKGEHFCFRYDITSKKSLEEIISSIVSRNDFLTMIGSITRALLRGQERNYRMENFCLLSTNIYINVNTKEAELIYLPIKEIGKKLELIHFYKNILFKAQFDPAEDTGYVVNIINYLNRKEEFTLRGFLKLIEDELLNASQVEKSVKQKEKKLMNKKKEDNGKNNSFFGLFGRAMDRLVGTGTMF